MNKDNSAPAIDLVYLWVNGNDPEWRKKHDAVTGVTRADSGVDCEGRYADNDELKFSLRSAQLYAPWIRRIFIVTDNQVPEWLDTSNPRVQIVDHTEILPPESLPCFNSPVIEHFLYKIPGLSEHFLYANDDMFFNRPVSPSDFFAADGLPIVRLSRRPLRRLTLYIKEKLLRKKISNYNSVIHRTAMIVKKHYGKYFSAKPHHNIDAYLKSDYGKTHEIFKAEIEPTIVNHVRSANDVQRVIYTYRPMADKRVHPQYVGRDISFRFHIDNHAHYAKLERSNPMLFCMNDSEYANNSDRAAATEFLKRRFPDKSEFEK